MTTGASIPMRITNQLLKLTGANLKGARFARWRRRLEQRADPAPARIPVSMLRQYRVEKRPLNGQTLFTLSPRGKSPKVAFLFTHGGAYVQALQSAHWAVIDALLKRTGAAAWVPTYPLAPQHTYREAFPHLEQVYRLLLNEHDEKEIVLCGDSAGGGLALAQALRYRDLGLPAPRRVILFSPWLDITLSNPAAAVLEGFDAILGLAALRQCGAWWAGEADPRDPLLSPLFGELGGLPSIDIFQGTEDLLLPDARLLDKKVRQAGGEVNLHEFPGAFHDFIVATPLPEAQCVFELIARELI